MRTTYQTSDGIDAQVEIDEKLASGEISEDEVILKAMEILESRIKQQTEENLKLKARQ